MAFQNEQKWDFQKTAQSPSLFEAGPVFKTLKKFIAHSKILYCIIL